MTDLKPGTTDVDDPRLCEAFVGRVLPAWVINDDLNAILRNLVQSTNDHVESCNANHPDEDMNTHEEAFFNVLIDAADTIYRALNPYDA